MVVQRDLPVHVWGRATPGEQVSVTFHDENKVVTTNKGCVALAVDGHKPCGPNGYANAPKLGQAQNTALQHCYKYGGKDCVIRAFICDGKKS